MPPRGNYFRARPFVERFWEKVDKSAGPDACWPWTGATQLRYKSKTVRQGRIGYTPGRLLLAHRAALMLATGEDRPNHEACHSCDNPICCNPAHLFWGTHRENLHDYIRKFGGIGRRKEHAQLEAPAPAESDADVVL